MNTFLLSPQENIIIYVYITIFQDLVGVPVGVLVIAVRTVEISSRMFFIFFIKKITQIDEGFCP